MDQATFDFATRPAAATTDRCGFELGWDHACHGLVPPPALLATPTPVAQGWQAARAVFGPRGRASPPALRQWLALRLQAWQQGLPFDRAGLGVADLARLAVRRCPVLRRPLGGAPQDALAAVHACLDPVRGHGPGRTVMLSRAAWRATDGLGVQALLRRAREAEQPGRVADVAPSPADASQVGAEGGARLDASAWRRLAVLRSFATPLPFAVAAGLPLVLLPPPGVRPCNPVQALQTLLTLQFAHPGWAGRLRRLAATLADPAQRQDLHLLVGALAPRVLEAGQAAASPDAQTRLREALEDAWLHERVLRRWQAWVLGLGEAGTQTLLQRLETIAVREGMPGAPAGRLQRMRPAPGLPNTQDTQDTLAIQAIPAALAAPADRPARLLPLDAATARPVRPARPSRPRPGVPAGPPSPSRRPGPGAGLPAA
jgi:hypothetical protein